MPAVQEDYLTPTQIGREYDKSPGAVVRWVQKGTLTKSGERLRLKGTRTPGGWRIARADLDAFFAALTADVLRPSQPAEPAPAPKAAHLRKIKAELAQKGF